MGLAFGAVGFVLLAGLSLTGASAGRRTYGWALAIAVLIVIGIQIEEETAPALTVGVVTMAVGGLLRARAARGPGSPFLWLAPAWLLILTGAVFSSWLAFEYSNPWFVPATVGVAVGSGWALSCWEDEPHRIALGPLFAITAFGVWTTVPDTDLARILVGIAVPLAVVTLPPFAVRISGPGAFGLAGALAWLPLWGGEQRTGSVIGAWACLGMIALLPVANRLVGGLKISMWQLVALHIGVVLVSARVIGLWDRATVAAFGVAVLAAAILVVVTVIRRQHPPAEQAG